MKIKALQSLLDFVRKKHSLEYTVKKKINFIKKIHKNYPNIINRIKKKIKLGQKINVGFYVVYDFTLSSVSIFEKMLQDDIFNPYIVVIPDICRDEVYRNSQVERTYNNLSKKYSNVYKTLPPLKKSLKA